MKAAAVTSEAQQTSLSNLEQRLSQIVADFQVASEKDAEQIAHLVTRLSFNPLRRATPSL